MIGLYPLSNISSVTQNASHISSFFSSESLTVATTLPNVILSTPSATTPSYVFNTSVPATPGSIVTTALGTSTYSALLNGATVNASALPNITLSPTLITLLVTDASGAVITSTETATTTSVRLGVPPGQSSSELGLIAPSISHTLLGSVALTLLRYTYL